MHLHQLSHSHLLRQACQFWGADDDDECTLVHWKAQINRTHALLTDANCMLLFFRWSHILMLSCDFALLCLRIEVQEDLPCVSLRSSLVFSNTSDSWPINVLTCILTYPTANLAQLQTHSSVENVISILKSYSKIWKLHPLPPLDGPLRLNYHQTALNVFNMFHSFQPDRRFLIWIIFFSQS